MVSVERSFRLDDLAASAEALAKVSPGDGRATSTSLDETGQPVPLSTEMVVALDEGRSIAQASDETAVGTEHALGGLGRAGVSTAAICAATASRARH